MFTIGRTRSTRERAASLRSVGVTGICDAAFVPTLRRGLPCETRLVRKQYHFWKSMSGDGVDAWDVDRLIELSADLPPSEVPVASIGEIDSVYWFDGDRHRPTVRAVVEHARLIQNVDTSYPIILGPDGRVMDGMHRIARAVLEDRMVISAVTFSELPEPDYRDCAPSDLNYDR